MKFRIIESKTHWPVRKNLKAFEKLLNEDPVCAVARKYPHRLKLTSEEEVVGVKLEKELRAPVRIEVGGASYLRSYYGGNRGAETLVRCNLEPLISRAKDVGKRMLRENDLGLLKDRCLDPDFGIARTGFVDSRGEPMKADQRAVYEMIKQLFKDAIFMRKLKSEIWAEFEKERSG